MAEGKIISFNEGALEVPDFPIIPFIEGDGIGPDIWRATRVVVDSSVNILWGEKRQIIWTEILAGEKAYNHTGNWLPPETLESLRTYRVGIKGPLTTPVGGGIRSLNVTLRQKLDLYACVRPIKHFPGVPSPIREPRKVNMVVFRENTEDVYAGMELKQGTEQAMALIAYLRNNYGWEIPADAGIGIKPISRARSRRLVKAALEHAIKQKRKSVTLVHKGNIQKFTEGAFRRWGYEIAEELYPDITISYDQCNGMPPEGKILIKDAIADIFFQQALTRPDEFDVIATTNLNGDYISDALAAQVGGVGMAPGANINYENGYALFEATHGTAPKYAGLDKVNPSSLILSACLMLEHIGWEEAARLIEEALAEAFLNKTVTYDLARLMPGATEVSCSKFAEIVCENMKKASQLNLF